MGYSFPVDPLFVLMIKKLKLKPVSAGIISLLVLYLPIIMIVSHYSRWVLPCINIAMCGHGALQDAFWMESNLYLTIPAVMIFYLLPGWIDSSIKKHFSPSRQDEIDINISEGITQKIYKFFRHWLWGVFLGIGAGIFYSQISLHEGYSWQGIPILKIYINVFWIVVLSIAIINLVRILGYVFILIRKKHILSNL